MSRHNSSLDVSTQTVDSPSRVEEVEGSHFLDKTHESRGPLVTVYSMRDQNSTPSRCDSSSSPFSSVSSMEEEGPLCFWDEVSLLDPPCRLLLTQGVKGVEDEISRL